MVARAIDKVLYYGSGEFLLQNRPNGGTVVFLRAIITTLCVYTFAIAVRELLAKKASWVPGLDETRNVLFATLSWTGPIFAAAYAALYARFASQWNYLASLYNEIKSAQVRSPRDAEAAEALASWKAGFIEDAEELHLHMKAVHAAVIVNWLKDDAVRIAYEDATPGGATRLATVEQQAKAAVAREEKKWSS